MSTWKGDESGLEERTADQVRQRTEEMAELRSRPY